MERILPKTPVSVLMPVCNEIDIIEDVVQEWHDQVIRHFPSGSELLFDDCSTDGTKEKLAELKKSLPYIRVIDSPRDGFFNSAMRLYKESRNPLVFFTDSDGQYVPAEIWALTPLLESADLVHGAKSNRQDPLYRLAASGVFNRIVRGLFGTAHRDVNSAFRFVKRPVLDALLPKIRHLTTLLNAELLLRAEKEQFRIQSIPVAHRERKYGKSRGLPPKRFVSECVGAYKGLKALKKEYEA
jgi:glycosyltransferase involved in cell wall biosynthesis